MGECGGWADRGGVREECWRACLPSERCERRVASAVSGGEVAGIVLGIPQHTSLFSPATDIPSPTSSVPMFSLD